ncbi:MAG: nucleotide pyrophosphohydrolase [Bacteroidia bacterium]|nr:nucleotide pyrophosphohydrolase [Bacteroidia bacterium]MCX7652118.1 nucleotide pyrophosphohydrolase [Bacteroidia bacterium]MDW8416129.1 nucleotide pyrophosphohydrolase [Bacteroidia bacterium]
MSAPEKPYPVLSLAQVQQRVDEWIQTIGHGYYSVLTNTVILMEEVGELARLMARHYGEQSFKPGENTSKEALAEEFADVLFVLTCLANQTGIDLQQAFLHKLEKKTQRDRERHAQRASERSQK